MRVARHHVSRMDKRLEQQPLGGAALVGRNHLGITVDGLRRRSKR
jgi:hypothetical protein